MVPKNYPFLCDWCGKPRKQVNHDVCITHLQQLRGKKAKAPRKPRNMERYYLDYLKPQILEQN